MGTRRGNGEGSIVYSEKRKEYIGTIEKVAKESISTLENMEKNLMS